MNISIYSGKTNISLSDLLDYQKEHANYMFSFSSKRNNDVIIDLWVTEQNTYEVCILHLNKINPLDAFENIYIGSDPVKAIIAYNNL